MTKLVNVFYNRGKEKINVGRLANEKRKIYFEYDKDFLNRGIELSPYKLPLKAGVFSNTDGVFEGLYGLFADSLPDGWGRLLLDRFLLQNGYNLSDITPLDRLMMIGKYGIGALSYEPIVKTSEFIKDIDLDVLANSSLNILKEVDEREIEALLTNNGSSAGARPKIMVQINDKNQIISGSQKLKSGFRHYMVKFASSYDRMEIGKLEFAYSLMAKDASMEMPNTKLLHGKNNSYFAIERFDRIKDERVHIHSLAGLVHSDFRFPSIDYDDILKLTLHLTKDINEVKKVYRLAVFNLLTYNRDDHAKNFSFLLDNDNKWKFAPAYDLTFSYGVNGEHATTYLGEGRNPTTVHLEKLAKMHSIRDYKNVIEEVMSTAENFKKYCKEARVSSKYANEIFSSFVKFD